MKTTEEIKALISEKIAGQGNQVDVGNGLTEILNAIVDMSAGGGGDGGEVQQFPTLAAAYEAMTANELKPGDEFEVHYEIMGLHLFVTHGVCREEVGDTNFLEEMYGSHILGMCVVEYDDSGEPTYTCTPAFAYPEDEDESKIARYVKEVHIINNTSGKEVYLSKVGRIAGGGQVVFGAPPVNMGSDYTAEDFLADALSFLLPPIVYYEGAYPVLINGITVITAGPAE